MVGATDKIGALNALVSFYWPLPAFLEVPNGWVTELSHNEDGGLQQWSGLDDDTRRARYRAPEFVARACFLHMPETNSRLDLAIGVAAAIDLPHMSTELIGAPQWGEDPDGEVFSFAVPAGKPPRQDRHRPDHGPQPETDGEESPTGEDIPVSGATHATVVHAQVVVPTDPCADDIAAAAERVELLVQDCVRALHHVTGRGYALPSLEATSFEVAIGLDKIVEDGLEARWNLGVHIPRASELTLTDGLGDLDLDLFTHSQQEVFVRTATATVLDLQRQAVAAGRRQADPRTAVVMAAATCESWTSLMFASMLWEDGATPEEGAAELGRPRNSRQRLNELGSRLKGSWDYSKVDALIAWDTDVRAARNRVLHAAGLPSLRLADRSIDAMYSLINLTLDRLCDGPVRNRYPMTALMMARETGLKKRGAWTRKLQVSTTRVRHLELLDAFERWYAVVQALMLPPTMRPAPDPTAKLELVQLLDNRAYWVQHDRRTQMARLVAPSGPLVERAVAAASHTPTPPPGRTVSFEETIPFDVTGEWTPEHNLTPGAAVLADPELWARPPAAPNSQKTRLE